MQHLGSAEEKREGQIQPKLPFSVENLRAMQSVLPAVLSNRPLLPLPQRGVAPLKNSLAAHTNFIPFSTSTTY